MPIFALSDPVQTAIILGVQAIILALIAQMGLRQKANATNIEKIEKATNSMKDALVEATRSDAFQKGKTAQKQETKAENKGVDVVVAMPPVTKLPNT